MTAFFAAVSVAAPAEVELDFSETARLPGIGLEIRLMPGSREVPSPSPTVYKYVLTRGDARTRIDLYDPVELWRQGQRAGKWKNENGNTLMIAKMTHACPGGFDREHVTREEYLEKCEKTAVRPGQWKTRLLEQWVRDLTGLKNVKAVFDRKPPYRFDNLAVFDFGARNRSVLAYSFKLNRSAPGQWRAPLDWIYVQFELAPGVSADRARRTVENQFLGELTSLMDQPQGEVEPSREFQDPRFLHSGTRSPEFKASVQRIAASISNMKTWWYVLTDHYIILSDLESEHRAWLRELQGNIEYLRSAYEFLIPAPGKIQTVSVVRVFNSPEDYVAYVGDDYKWSGGVWMADKKELVIRPVTGRGGKDRKDRVFRTMYHEGFHQYIYYALDQIVPAVWYNEGHAVLFENAEISHGRLTLEEDERMTRCLEKILDRETLNVADVLGMSYEQFYAPDDAEARQRNYTVAWALVYYLRKGAPLERTNRYEKIPGAYLKALWETKDPHKATKQAFKDVRMKEFTQSFKDFWNSGNSRGRARRNRLFRSYRAMR
ncbi:MAG: DUF1570 domain-containing protein [Kiritimatiellia bacterium]